MKLTNSKNQGQYAILFGILLAAISFVYDIYKGCYENISITTADVNQILLKSVILGLVVGVLLFLLTKKSKNEQQEKGIPIKKAHRIIMLCGLLMVACGTILYFNHWQFAYIVLWVGALVLVAEFVIMIYYNCKKKKAKEIEN
ncbi:MAG: hypothetical protein LBN95_00120 [Prevotellaceae bacterium]|jgi:uncharacterized protein involved in response to NO|nr:hypothetical protein [Prevotellaceae bacterium]